MTDRFLLSSPRLKARLAGVCYLMTIGVGAFDHVFVGRRLVDPGDAAATVHNILASEPLYRAAFAADLIPVYIVVTALFYDLFKPVNETLSRLAAFASLVGGAVGSAICLFQLSPLVVMGGGTSTGALGLGQLQALTLIFLRFYDVGFTVSLVFFGVYCALIGWLIVGSTFMPRLVGALMIVGGLAYMTYSFTDFISPSLAARLASPAMMLGGLGEAVLTLWLLLVGVNAGKWSQQARRQREAANAV